MKYLLLFTLFSNLLMNAQDSLMPVILLDDIVIENNNDFCVDDFIDYVKQDTTFYMGFKHLRYYSHNYDSELFFLDNKGRKLATIKRSGFHYSNGSKAWLINDSIYTSGNIFKRNGEYRYYTIEAFDEVFFVSDTFDVSLKISRDKNISESQNMRDAKTVGFSIGTDKVEQSKLGLSKKLAVFDEDMQKYYDYIISETIYKNIDCYVFKIQLKKNLSKRARKKVLVQNIISYFDKENFNVIYRDYKFAYKNIFIDLNMHIVVHMDYIGSKHLPVDIYYKGFWDVPFLKEEKAEFRLKNSNYMAH